MTVKNFSDRLTRRIMRYRVNQLIKKSEFNQISECPICKCDQLTEIAKLERHNLRIKTTKCSECGLAFHNPMPDANFLNDFYANYYQGLQRGSIPNKGVLERELQRAVRAKRMLEGYDFNSILDVGSSAGRILHFLGNELDIPELYGIEPDAKYAKFSEEKYNIKVSQCMLENFHSDKKFDCVLMMHGLEHLLELDLVLNRVRNIMHVGSTLYLETPNFMKLSNKLSFETGLLISKLYSFSPKNLKLLLSNNGFEIVRLENLHEIHMQIVARPVK